MNFFVTVCLFMSIVQLASAQKNYFKDLPENCSPEKVGAILSRNFIPSKHMWYGKGKWIHYAEVCTWYGALRYAEITGDKQLAGQLKDRFDLLVTMEKSHLPIMDHVDLNVFGCIPLELYKITKDKKYLERVYPMLIHNGLCRLMQPQRKKPGRIKDYLGKLVFG